MALGHKKKSKHKGQRNETCQATGCTKKGRILAILGGIPLAYCPEHRKKFGERIINAMINSCFNYKLTNFLSEIKSQVFMSHDFLCEDCGNKLKDYIILKTDELENVIKYAKDNDAKVDEEDLK